MEEKTERRLRWRRCVAPTYTASQPRRPVTAGRTSNWTILTAGCYSASHNNATLSWERDADKYKLTPLSLLPWGQKRYVMLPAYHLNNGNWRAWSICSGFKAETYKWTNFLVLFPGEYFLLPLLSRLLHFVTRHVSLSFIYCYIPLRLAGAQSIII